MQSVTHNETLFCINHPDEETVLQCSKCLQPICTRCAIRTPVGLRCPECSGAKRTRDGSYYVPSLLSQVSTRQYVQAVLAACGIALIGGIAWGQWRYAGDFSDWSFWWMLLISVCAGEGVARAANDRRTVGLQWIAASSVLIAAVVATAWNMLITLDWPIDRLGVLFGHEEVRSLIGLSLANGLFVILGMVIASRRLQQ